MKKLFLLLLGFSILDRIFGWTTVPGVTCILADPITGAIAGGLGLAQGLFGTSSQQTQGQRSFTQFRPEDLQRIEAARGGYQGSVGDLMSQLGASREALQKGIVMPSSQFQFSATPDAITRALAAQATQGLAQQAGTQQQRIAQQFQGNPAASRALQAQAGMQARLAANPALFQAFQQQQGRELSQAQQAQAAAEAANRALLGREQAVTGLAQTGMGAQQNLLSSLLSLGQGLGQQIQTGEMKGRSGGLFGK
jgi:hypothetical protein